jgi:hypothetical protein
MSKKGSILNLRRLNAAATVLFAAQAIAILILANKQFALPVSTSYLTLDGAGHDLVIETTEILHIPPAYIAAAFLGVAAVAHLFVATIHRKRYERNLGRGLNKVRWIEYALSAPPMLTLIAMLSGIDEMSTLIAIFGLTMIAALLGLTMEIHNQTTERTNWLSYVAGCIAGLLPWALISVAYWGNQHYGYGSVPGYVYWMFGTLLLIFLAMAANMLLSYKKVGPWRNYLNSERLYILLSLLAKAALAWQIFAAELRLIRRRVTQICYTKPVKRCLE